MSGHIHEFHTVRPLYLICAVLPLQRLSPLLHSPVERQRGREMTDGPDESKRTERQSNETGGWRFSRRRVLKVCAATGAIAGLGTFALGQQETTYHFGGGEGAETRTPTGTGTASETPAGTGTTTETPTETDAPASTVNRILDARTFEIEPLERGTFACVHRSSEEREYPVERFRVVVSPDALNDTFPLSTVIDDSQFGRATGPSSPEIALASTDSFHTTRRR